MLSFVPFDPAHLMGFEVDPTLLISMEDLLSEDLGCLVGSHSWTGIDGSLPVACGGLQEIWPGRSFAWSLLSPEIGVRNFLSVDRRVRHEIREAQSTGMRRIEAAIDPFYPQGLALRWALSLGFQVEGYMRNWTQDGRDMCLVSCIGERR